MYVDVLKAPSLLSLSLQDDGLDIVQGIKQILSSSKALKAILVKTLCFGLQFSLCAG